jgi:hypothetical protein
MSVVVTQTLPKKWSWSKNPMTISFFNPGDRTARLRFEVYIADRYSPSGWTMVFDGSQTFSQRLTIVELQRILDSNLKFYHNHPLTNASGYTDGIIPGVIYEGQTCRYKVRYGLSSEAYSTWNETVDQWCVKGGVSIDGFQKNLTALNDTSVAPIVLHQGLYMQYTEAPVQISLLYRGGIDTIQVQTLDASTSVIDTYTFDMPASITEGVVIHLSMKLDLAGVAFVQINYGPTPTGMITPPYQILACPAVMTRMANYRLYSYINSLGGTDAVVMLWNRIETLNYDEQVTERAAPITADNALDPLIYSEMNSDRRERIVMNGDVAQLMQFYGTKYYGRVFNQLRQMCLSPDIREYEWGFYELGNINRDAELIGTNAWSGYYLRHVPVTITNTNTQSIVIGNVDNQPDPFTIEVTKSTSNSQYQAQERRSCIDHDYALMTGGERYARLTFMIDSNLFNYTLATTDTFAPRVGIDAGDGRYLWNTAALAYGTVAYRVIHVDFYYQPQIPQYTITINQAGQTIKAISGQIPPGTTIFTAVSGPITVFDAILPVGLLELHLASNSIGAMPLLIPGMTTVDLSDNGIIDLTTEQINAIVSAYSAGVCVIVLQGNALQEVDMDTLLVALDTSGYTGGHLDIRFQGGGINPTSIGFAAAANMTGTKGWTINI